MTSIEVCKLALEQMRQTQRLLTRHFVDRGLPEPDYWDPLASLDQLEEAISVLEPLQEGAEGGPPRHLRLVVDNARVG